MDLGAAVASAVEVTEEASKAEIKNSSGAARRGK
jgi:hypothetical protein